MYTCEDCDRNFKRSDNLQRHIKNKHTFAPDMTQTSARIPPSGESGKMTFQHPFTMVVSGPTEWIRKLFLFSLIEPSPERIIWCFGQWQPLYDELQRRFRFIEFVHGIPDYINEPRYLDIRKKNLIVFDDLMTEAKCDQRIADLFTKGSHHRNLSVIYLTQNLFPQGKACRDIALNTQYLVLFNNPIDRQKVVTLARRIYPTNSTLFMKRFEQATSRPYGYLVVDLKSGTLEQDRLRTDIFEQNETRRMRLSPSDTNFEHRSNFDSQSIHDDDDNDDDDDVVDDVDDDDDDDDTFVNGKKRLIPLIGPPGKRFKEDLEDERSRREVWDRRFQEPLRQSNQEQFKMKVNESLEQGYILDEAISHAANNELPRLRKMLRRAYAEFLIDFYTLQKDPTQLQILQSERKLRRQHDMTVAESIRQAVKLRKDLFDALWPDHVIEQTISDSEDEEDVEEDEKA